MWSVEFYVDARDQAPAYEFIESLSPQERATTMHAIDLLVEYGTRLGMPHARRVEGALWELRAGSGRLFYFLYTGRTFIILHGYRKKTAKAPRREIEMALRRMNDALERQD